MYLAQAKDGRVLIAVPADEHDPMNGNVKLQIFQSMTSGEPADELEFERGEVGDLIRGLGDASQGIAA